MCIRDRPQSVFNSFFKNRFVAARRVKVEGFESGQSGGENLRTAEGRGKQVSRAGELAEGQGE